VINEIAGALGDIGFTIPGQAWTYWNKGPGPGPSYTETDEGHDWSASTGEAAAGNLVAVAAPSRQPRCRPGRLLAGAADRGCRARLAGQGSWQLTGGKRSTTAPGEDL
jgi:hypothetical protein